MTIKEIKEEIKEVENQLFYLAMKDYWDSSDYEDERELIEKKNKLKAQLKELEKWDTLERKKPIVA